MELVNLVQGTPEWHAHRVKYFNASEAPAMLGVSHYKTRADLLRERLTGVTPEVPPAVAARFAEGHRAEALARTWVETSILCEDLFPVVGVKGKLSASFDGLTIDESIGFEHKITNQRLRDALPIEGENPPDKLPEEYRAQMEQQLFVSGAQKIIFMASSWDKQGRCLEKRYCWYTSDPAMRQRILRGWEEFERDLAKKPEEGKVQAVPATFPVIRAGECEAELPAPLVTMRGDVATGGNLTVFGNALKVFIASVPQAPETDQDFVECIAAIKSLKKAEESLDAAMEDAIAQIDGVAQMRRAAADLRLMATAARKRLELCVNEEKKARRNASIDVAQQKFSAHVADLSAGLGEGVTLTVPEPDFAAAIKGLCSADSIENKLQSALLEGKARADLVAAAVRANLERLRAVDRYRFLFPDRLSLLYSAEDTLKATIEARVADFNQQIEKIIKERVAAAVAEAQAAWMDSKAPESASAQVVEEESVVYEESNASLQNNPDNEQVTSQDNDMVSLNSLNERIMPFSVTRTLLAGFGIEPDAIRNRSAHYRPSQASAACKILSAHFDSAAKKIEAAAPPETSEKLRFVAHDLLSTQDAIVVSLNTLNNCIAPFSVTRTLLAGFGIEPDAIHNRSAHYRPSQASAACKIMSAHLERAARKFEEVLVVA
ncbi:MAG: YqaJ viral recombinase family protein [Actinomycetaceae bacterium]|nr:YqaJ viral recombinase family protein [Actinomycetaceae bacterium]